MNIADQLITIAENEQKVYNAGYEKGKAEGGGSGIDWSKTTDFSYFSYQNNRNDLVSELNYENTSNGVAFTNMFSECSDLTTIPPINTSNGYNHAAMFSGCSNLTEIPNIDTKNSVNINSMFNRCSKLRTIPLIDTSKCTLSSGRDSIFNNCTALEEVRFAGVFRIMKNMKVFSSSPNLTVESLVSFLNALSNNKGQPRYTVTIGSTNLAKLSDEQKKIAINKNITLA